VTLFSFADCQAADETGAVHALLTTGYGACLRPGQHFQANPLTLRPRLAEAQYRFVRARRADRAD
jgi:hypothetical protein